MKKTRFKTIDGAVRRIKQLERQITSPSHMPARVTPKNPEQSAIALGLTNKTWIFLRYKKTWSGKPYPFWLRFPEAVSHTEAFQFATLEQNRKGSAFEGFKYFSITPVGNRD